MYICNERPMYISQIAVFGYSTILHIYLLSKIQFSSQVMIWYKKQINFILVNTNNLDVYQTFCQSLLIDLKMLH